MLHLITKRFRSYNKHDVRMMLWFSGGLFLAGIFLKLTWELSTEKDLEAFDRMVMTTVASWRAPIWNGSAVDITALGSVTLGVTVSIIAITLMLFARDRAGAIHLFAAGAGSALWNQLLKTLIARPRPDIVPHLVEVTGMSYPSGHSMSAAAIYLTLGILAARHFKSWYARGAIFALASCLIALVGLSRVYLGVHYPSDTISGIALGCAWALFLGALFSRRYWRE